MEGLTKWDPSRSKPSTEAYCLYSHVKLLEDHYTTFSAVSALEAELVRARLRIHELEAEHRLSKKRFEALMRKLGEERNSWYIRKHHKMRAIVDVLKDEINKERKSRKKISFLNSKLMEELAEAKSSAKQFLQDYEEEKKDRELLEEICNELAKKIGEDKVELEYLKSETMRIREEVEEERNMLQLAEVWREERVQMKLVDAKLALEHKYWQMNKLVAELESFLRSSAATLDVMALRKAELVIQSVKSLNIQDNKEFEYVPVTSDSIFSILEEIRPSTNEREMGPLVKYSPVCNVSNYHIESPDVNGFGFDDNNVPKRSNGYVASNNGLEDDFRVLESSRHAEDQGSGYSFEGTDHLANGVTQGKTAARRRIMCYESSCQHSPNTGISDVRQKSCSVSQLRPLPSNGEFYKIISDEGNARLIDRTISSAGTTTPLRMKSVDLGNPHITRGMKGSIEWPRVTRKRNLKGKLLKAMIESQKTHLRKVMK